MRSTSHNLYSDFFFALFLHLLLLLPASWLTKECVRHLWFTYNENLKSCGCREASKLCKHQVWFPSHIKENKLNSIWKISLAVLEKGTSCHNDSLLHADFEWMLESTRAKPHYLRTRALQRRGAGHAIKAHTQCPRTHKEHPSPCTDCLPPHRVGAQPVPQLFRHICHY